MEFRIKNRDLCDIIWKNYSSQSQNSLYERVDIILDIIKTKFSLKENHLMIIEKKLQNSFIPIFKKKWISVSRTKTAFLNKYNEFLEADFIVCLEENVQSSTSNNVSIDTLDQSNDLSKKRKGRPKLSYETGSEKTKRRRIGEVSSTITTEKISKICEIIDHVDITDTEDDLEDGDNSHKSAKTLAMYLDLNLTKRKYEKLKKHNKQIYDKDPYPAYIEIYNAKNACCPDNGEHIQSLDSGAKINFISLLGHTVKRILQLKSNDLASLQNETLVLIGKWGMDGAHAQQITRQRFSMTNNTFSSDESSDEDAMPTGVGENITDNCIDVTDKSLFLVSFVPLQLETLNGNIIWTNTVPSSVHFCRIIAFKFVKESDKLTRKTYRSITKLLEKVENFVLDVTNISLNVNFDISCTMIDGKTCNALCKQKASTRCNICGVGPKFVNNLEYVLQLPCNTSFYKYGLSTLHQWIRVLEYLLHVSYNLELKTYYIKTAEQKEQRKARQFEIQKQLKLQLQLTVDVVKQGYGTSNTGNVARLFLEKADDVAKITGLNKELIVRLHNILQVVTCGKKVDCDKFKVYCYETAKHAINEYPWYKLPPSIHKLLIHGSEIIRFFKLPIGWFSEEPQEGNNKIFRSARVSNSRMSNRKLTNEDIMRHMLAHSDPLVSSFRIKEKKKSKQLSETAESMVIVDD